MSDEVEVNELDTLKSRADMMGIGYHPKIGLDKLKAKINKELSSDVEEEAPAAVPEVESKRQRLGRLRKESARLVRVNVTCMNPTMKDHEGGVYTVSNGVVGTHKKYVPFNSDWHVPTIIYKHMKERMCQIFQNAKGPRGERIKSKKMIPELSIQLLNPLTGEEIKDLATQQAMANNLD